MHPMLTYLKSGSDLNLILSIDRRNIVIARDEEEHVPFRLLGEDKHVKSFGVHVSLIDFTLSRLDTGFNTEHPKRVRSFCHILSIPFTSVP